MFVVDASVVSNWCLPDESHPYADAAQIRIATEDAITPAIFWFELRNVLLVAERRGRITGVQTAALLAAVGQLPIKEDKEPNDAVLLGLARMHQLTIYDAAYLELAKRNGLVLATLDKPMIGAAKVEKVPLVGEPSAP
jgi:predicted nucleic acid-binding protein